MPNILSQGLETFTNLKCLITLINVKIAARLERKSFLFFLKTKKLGTEGINEIKRKLFIEIYERSSWLTIELFI